MEYLFRIHDPSPVGVSVENYLQIGVLGCILRRRLTVGDRHESVTQQHLHSCGFCGAPRFIPIPCCFHWICGRGYGDVCCCWCCCGGGYRWYSWGGHQSVSLVLVVRQYVGGKFDVVVRVVFVVAVGRLCFPSSLSWSTRIGGLIVTGWWFESSVTTIDEAKVGQGDNRRSGTRRQPKDGGRQGGTSNIACWTSRRQESRVVCEAKPTTERGAKPSRSGTSNIASWKMKLKASRTSGICLRKKQTSLIWWTRKVVRGWWGELIRAYGRILVNQWNKMYYN